MSSARRQYPFHLIEPKWQQSWEREETFRAWSPGEAVPENHPFARRHPASRGQAGALPPKFYILDMFPYPSGAGLHVGHPEGYTATDILARYRRACGAHVLHPIGWDAFGLPAEQYAIKTGQHPRVTTNQNISTFKRQIKSLGFSYDWSREIDTTDPNYFKWTQWIFLQMYNAWFNSATNKAEPISTLTYPPELQVGRAVPSTPELAARRRAYVDSKRLAYVAGMPVWWCEELGTVLANEEVIDGKSEVGGFPVVRKPMRQWMLRITAYAEKLLQDLDRLDWSESLKEMQRNWIGRSEGAEVNFQLAGSETAITVFTTRPDTLFGATYMVLSPEHKLVDLITTPEQREAVEKYKAYAAAKSDLERTALEKEKTGVFTGAYVINPVNNERIAIWIADYVLISYGTGAIMAVPGHDTRDLEFARKFNLPIRVVVQAPEGKESVGYVEDGVSVDSGLITGLPTPEAKKKITAWLDERGLGRKTINYKLRDWLFSRQRYWGEPFPIVWRQDQAGHWHHEALPESALPVLPPPLEDYKPTPDGQPPLARAKEWVNLPDGAVRETNTMPQWAGSCWYYLRYLDPRNDQVFTGRDAERYWMSGPTQHATRNTQHPTSPFAGVDLYVGGAEHAVLHLLYARFWHKVLYDLGHVSTPEPFHKLVNQGLILGEMEFTAFTDAKGQPVSAADLRDIEEEATATGPKMIGIHKGTGEKVYSRRVSEDEIEKRGEGFCLKSNAAIRVDARTFKMSKSRGNVINPDQILAEFGADAFRLYEMFMGPLEMVKPWSTKGVEGVYRFLGRVWRLFVDEKSETEFNQSLAAEPNRGLELLEKIQLNPAIQEAQPAPAQLKALHACIKKVTEDLEGMRFNTAISAMMVFINEATTWEGKPRSILRDFLILLQPFAPHIAEELFAKLESQSAIRNPQSAIPLAYQPWPKYDPALLVEDTLEIPVQVNGKLRDRIVVPASAAPPDLERAALASEKVKTFLQGKTVKKVIVVPGKLVNIAAG